MADKRGPQLALSQSSVLKLYHTVIDDVIANVRDAFLDEGVDENVLQELKQTWRTKLMASKAIEIAPEPQHNDAQPPPIVQNNPRTSKAALAKARKIAAAGTPMAMANGNRKDTAGGQNPPPLQTTSSGASGSQMPQTSSNTIPAVATLDPNRVMPVNITLPAQAGAGGAEPRVLTIHVPASALQENTLTQILTASLVSSIMSLPTQLASSVLQQHVNAALTSVHLKKKQQLDGALDSSEDDESEESDADLDVEDDVDLDRDEDEIDDIAEEEPLNSEDDVSDDEGEELFETDNVIVCQYDKITRSRNKWKFYLKDGIMSLNGKDYVFQKSNGEAEW